MRILLILLFVLYGHLLWSQSLNQSETSWKLDSQILAIEHAPVRLEKIQQLDVQEQMEQSELQAFYQRRVWYHNHLGNQLMNTPGVGEPNLEYIYTSVAMPGLELFNLELNTINGVPFFNNTYHFNSAVNALVRYVVDTDQLKPFVGIGINLFEVDLAPTEERSVRAIIRENSAQKPMIQQKGIIEIGIQRTGSSGKKGVDEWHFSIRYSSFNPEYRIYNVYDDRSTIQATLSLLY